MPTTSAIGGAVGGRSWRIGACALLVLGAGTGCSSYRLRGTVVPGLISAVMVVDAQDTRLSQQGLAGARIELTVDPASMRPVPAGAARTDTQGRFDIPLKQPGVGFLEYELAVLCRADGHSPTYQVLPLPPSHRRLLVLMAAGPDRGAPPPDVLQETLKLKEQLLQP